jgi:hypothetical protein
MANTSVRNRFLKAMRRSQFSNSEACETMTAAITPWIKFIKGTRNIRNRDFGSRKASSERRESAARAFPAAVREKLRRVE